MPLQALRTKHGLCTDRSIVEEWSNFRATGCTLTEFRKKGRSTCLWPVSRKLLESKGNEGLVRLADSAGICQPQQYFSLTQNQPAIQPNSIFLSHEISQPASQPASRTRHKYASFYSMDHCIFDIWQMGRVNKENDTWGACVQDHRARIP